MLAGLVLIGLFCWHAAVRGGQALIDVSLLRRRGFGAFRELAARLAEESPLVLFIDDLHWGEPVFLDLVDRSGRIQLHATVDATPWLAHHSWLIAGGVLAGAGAYLVDAPQQQYRCDKRTHQQSAENDGDLP